MILAEPPAGVPSPVLLGGVAAVVVGLLTGVVRRLTLARAVLDVPNERSLHTSPTPRGGGVAVAVVVLAVIGWLGLRALLPGRVVIGLAGGAIIVALVGWIDDVRSLPNRVRAGAQAVAAIWFLYWIGGVTSLRMGEALIPLGIGGSILALVGIVWSINLYNFMDGIDGLAGGQAVVAATIATILLADRDPGLALTSAAIAGAAIGFLAWNWAPARIFLGDTGSGLLGFLFAALAILSERSAGPSAVSWVLLGAVFVFDATVTLVRRMMRGERWYAAHKSHAYQRAVRSGFSHARVTGGAILLSGVTGALAAALLGRPDLMWPICLAAVVLLTAVYLWIERRMPMGDHAGGTAASS